MWKWGGCNMGHPLCWQVIYCQTCVLLPTCWIWVRTSTILWLGDCIPSIQFKRLMLEITYWFPLRISATEEYNGNQGPDWRVPWAYTRKWLSHRDWWSAVYRWMGLNKKCLRTWENLKQSYSHYKWRTCCHILCSIKGSSAEDRRLKSSWSPWSLQEKGMLIQHNKPSILIQEVLYHNVVFW